MSNWLKAIWFVLPKKFLGRFIIESLQYAAYKFTKTKADDEFLENVEKWLVRKKVLDPEKTKIIPLEEAKKQLQEGSLNEEKSSDKEQK